MFILWLVDSELLLLHNCSWKRNHVALNVKCGFNLLHSLFCFVFLCFISLCGLKLWPWKVRKWRKWKSEIWGVLTLKSQGNHEALSLVVRLKCKWTPQINYFGTHLLMHVGSLKCKSYIMSPRWHLGLVFVGTELAINCTYVPIVAPFPTEHVYRNRKHGCSSSTSSLCCANSVTNRGIQDLHTALIFHVFQLGQSPGAPFPEISGWMTGRKLLNRWKVLCRRCVAEEEPQSTL